MDLKQWPSYFNNKGIVASLDQPGFAGILLFFFFWHNIQGPVVSTQHKRQLAIMFCS